MPGNHDRLGDDMGDTIMPGARVQIVTRDGLHIVRVNSTGDHNRSWIAGHGILLAEDLDAIDAALDETPRDHLAVIALHHHVVPLPEEHAAERLSFFLGWPFTAELARGRELLDRTSGAVRAGPARSPARSARRAPARGHAHDPHLQRRQLDAPGRRARLRARGRRARRAARGGSRPRRRQGQGVTWAATPTVSHDREWRVA